MTTPYFSVVVPVFNRAKLIRRALESCLTQTFKEFELIVVDDCSTDSTPDEVRALGDPRIKLIRHLHNRGVCPAQNTGTEAAVGQWVIYLHSDDEFLPSALEIIHRRAKAVAADIHSLRFNFRCPNGKFSPDPAFDDQVLDYEGFIRWTSSVTGSADNVLCVRRSTYPTVQFPDNHSFEGIYMLDFSKRFKVQCCREAVSMKHFDAPNQLTHDFVTANLKYVSDHVETMDALLARHGDALRRYSTKSFYTHQRAAAIGHLQAGNRMRGAGYALRYLAREPRSSTVWASLCLGMVSPQLLARVRQLTAA